MKTAIESYVQTGFSVVVVRAPHGFDRTSPDLARACEHAARVKVRERWAAEPLRWESVIALGDGPGFAYMVDHDCLSGSVYTDTECTTRMGADQ